MTEQQHLRLLALQHALKKRAVPVGSLHSLWDIIFDIQAFMEGKPTILKKTAEEWISYAEKLLKD